MEGKSILFRCMLFRGHAWRMIRQFARCVCFAFALLGLTGTLAAQELTVSAPKVSAATGKFYSIRADFRKCISPICGGYFISEVNRRFTRCADGSRQKECYVASIEWKRLGLPGLDGASLVLGVQELQNFDGFGPFGILVPKKAWRPAGDADPKGRWVSLQQTDIVCVSHPCYNIKERFLNRKRKQLISGVDLDKVDAHPKDLDLAAKLLATDGLIAAGRNRVVRDAGPAGDGLTFFAKQFFLPIHPDIDPNRYCESDLDCTASAFHSPVRSRDDCYCTLCPMSLNAEAASANQEGWTRHCQKFGYSVLNEKTAELTCPQVFCYWPGPAACVNKQCVFEDTPR